MNRGLRLFGHPLHALASDLPITLLGTSVFWDAIGWFRHDGFWWAMSFWSLSLGLAAAGVTAIAGLVDYIAIPSGGPALGTGLRHMVVMGLTVIVYLVDVVVRRGPAMPMGSTQFVVLGLEGFGLLLLSIGGWLGGHLVFHYGIGRD